jgi:hypothetical protein
MSRLVDVNTGQTAYRIGGQRVVVDAGTGENASD